MNRVFEILQVEDPNRGVEVRLAFVEFVVDEEIPAVFGPPAGMHVARIGVGRGTQQFRSVLLAEVPDVDRVFIEVEQDFAGFGSRLAGRRPAIGDDHGSGIVAVAAHRQGDLEEIVRIAYVEGPERPLVVEASKHLQKGWRAVHVQGDARGVVDIADVHVVGGSVRPTTQPHPVREFGEIEHDKPAPDFGADVGMGSPTVRVVVEALRHLDVAPTGRCAGYRTHLEWRPRIGDVDHRKPVYHAEQRVFTFGVEVHEPPDVRHTVRNRREVATRQVGEQVDVVAGVAVGRTVGAGSRRAASLGGPIVGNCGPAHRIKALPVDDHVESTVLELVSQRNRNAGQRGRVGCGVLQEKVVETVVPTANVHRTVDQLQGVQDVAELVRAAGDPHLVSLSRHGKGVPDGPTRPHGERAVAFILALLGNIAGYSIVAVCRFDQQ